MVLKLDLFDRRWKVVAALREVIGLALQDGDIERSAILKFGYDVVGTRWRFDEKVEAYLMLVRKKNPCDASMRKNIEHPAADG